MPETEKSGSENNSLEGITNRIRGIYQSNIERELPANIVYSFCEKTKVERDYGISTYNTRDLSDKEIKSISNETYDQLNYYFHTQYLEISKKDYNDLLKLRTHKGDLSVDLLTKAHFEMSRNELYYWFRDKIEERAKDNKDLTLDDLLKILNKGIQNHIKSTLETEYSQLQSNKYAQEMKEYINKTLEDPKVKVPQSLKDKIRVKDDEKYWFELFPKYMLLIQEVFGKGKIR